MNIAVQDSNTFGATLDAQYIEAAVAGLVERFSALQFGPSPSNL